MPRKNDLRVWWIPQVPGKAFHVPVESLNEACIVLDTLARYDLFQLENNIKPDFSNAGGLQVFKDGEWVDWESDTGESIDEWMDFFWYTERRQKILKES